MRDTIYALSSGATPAGVAVIRMSGSAVRFGLETVIGSVPPPRQAHLCDIRDSSGMLLDRGLVLFFPAPRSYTGEDVAELQIHGGRASVSAVLSALSRLSGFRLAEPGEYTRRAFENGRMDLTAVEGLSDLIRAETEAQRRQALDQSDGSLKKLYEGWAKRLTHARAMIEAELDFSDEEDIRGSVADKIWPDMELLSQEISEHLSGAKAAEVVRDGLRIALIGSPNAGKSSLLNALARRDVAIVSETAGTTRDVIEVRLDIGGNLVLLQDTAGLRESDDDIEIEGMRRSMMIAEGADLVLNIRDARLNHNNDEDRCIDGQDMLTVWTKSDLIDSSDSRHAGDDILVSNVSGAGMNLLITKIGARISEFRSASAKILPTRERHVQLLTTCLHEIDSALLFKHQPLEIQSEFFRNASSALGRITGLVDVEDLLGVIFSEFCVGK